MVFPYEQQAMNGEPMPENLDWLDQRMYVALRNLYGSAKSGTISRETGSKEKAQMVSFYNQERENEEFNRKWVKHTVDLWKGIELAVNRYQKNRTLANADDLVKAISGINAPDFNLNWAKE